MVDFYFNGILKLSSNQNNTVYKIRELTHSAFIVTKTVFFK
jgi:hypothetical protein